MQYQDFSLLHLYTEYDHFVYESLSLSLPSSSGLE